jgi:hypothetical protein
VQLTPVALNKSSIDAADDITTMDYHPTILDHTIVVADIAFITKLAFQCKNGMLVDTQVLMFLQVQNIAQLLPEALLAILKVNTPFFYDLIR